MNDTILNDVLRYIDFLKDMGYYISLSGFDNKFEPYTNKLLNYEIHLHRVCFCLKQHPNTMGKCILNKKKLNEANITKPLYSCCYAGVEEYIVPIFYQDDSIMRINISGYRDNLLKSKKFSQRISKKCNEDFQQLYLELSPDPPSLDNIMRFINPLKYMIVELYKHCQMINKNEIEISSTKQIYINAIHYINENYTQQISCESLSSALNYSLSYIQYALKKEGKTTVKALIINTRLSRAKYLLLHSQFSITDIAFACGFLDSNYFSTAFKSKYGVSPKKYRALHS